MDEHVDAATSEKETPAKAPPSPDPPAPPPIQPPINPAPSPPTPGPEQNNKSDKMEKSDKIMIWATAVIAVGTLVSAGAIVLQWREMVSGGADTNALVGYSQRQADDADKMKDSAEKSAEASKRFADSAAAMKLSIDDAVSKLNLQAGALTKGASQTGRLANAAEQANKNAAIADRPWFGADISVTDFEVGKIPKATIIFRNAGKRPALDTGSIAQGNQFYSFPIDPPYNPDPSPRGKGVVVENGTATIAFNPWRFEITQGDFDRWTLGTQSFYIYAAFNYIDIQAGTPHFAHFCWRYIGNIPGVAKGFYACDTYEGTDDH